MALTKQSSFLYGFQITSANSSLDFKNSSGGSTLLATLNTGFYSLQDLMAEVVRAMNAADPANNYSYLIDRTFSSGTQNRVTISTNGAYLDLLFGTGPRLATSIASTIGFTNTDQTGATSYQSTSSAGTILLPSYVGYTYIPPTMMQKMIGSKNVAASGLVETIYFATHQFFQVEFKYEPQAKVLTEWASFMQWAAKGRPIEFTADTTSANTVFNATLDKTSYDSNGMGYQFKEMLPDMPFLYTTGQLTFRIIPAAVSYI